MARLYSGKVTKMNGEVEEFENLTEDEVFDKADLRNPDVMTSKYREVLDTDH